MSRTTPFWPILLFTAIFLSPAHADELAWSRIQCTPLAAMDASIRYCTDNVHASTSALSCSAQLSRAWADAAKDLAVVQQGLDASASQRLQLGRSQEHYDLAVDHLRTLIDVTKRNTDIVAQYPTVMVDNPLMDDFSESLPCFRDVYGQIQQTVIQLDRQVAQGRKVLASALRLRSSVKSLADGVKSRPGETVAHAGPAERAPARYPAAKRPTEASDITGVKKEPGI